MDNLKSLEEKVEFKKNPTKATTDEVILNGIDKIVDEIQRVYRLCSKANNREERRLQYLEDKVNKILEILKYKEVDTDVLKRMQEIEELENKLKKLKKEV